MKRRYRLNECGCGCGGTSSACMNNKEERPESYMFFGNLQTIRRAVDAMMQMDPNQVDQILQNGHNWAADHIATSKDDIEEVAGFLMNEMESPYFEKDKSSNFLAKTFESYIDPESDDEMSDLGLAEKLMKAVRMEDWSVVRNVAMALRYREQYRIGNILKRKH